MGDPRRMKNKYNTPIHPWEKLRLEAEKPLMKEYGLVNKKELWKVSSKLKNFKDTAKKLVAAKSAQAETEKRQMVDRMKSYGLISTDELDEILGLEVNQLLDRRLQTVVFKKGLARTIKQARQMITHRHIAVNGIKITAPSYLVKLSEQDSVLFMPTSKFDNDAHPERATAEVIEDVKGRVKAVDAEVKEKAEAKPAEKKAEEKSDAKVDDKKVDDKKADEKSDAEVKEKAEAKTDEKSDEKSDAKVDDKKVDEKVDEKSDDKKSDAKKDDDDESAKTAEKVDA